MHPLPHASLHPSQPNLGIATPRPPWGTTPSWKFANWPKKENKRRANWNHISELTDNLHIWRTWRGGGGTWEKVKWLLPSFRTSLPPSHCFSFFLLCFISLRVAARALATPWRLNVIFYSYLFIKARKAAHRLNCDRPHSRPCHASCSHFPLPTTRHSLRTQSNTANS